MSAWFAVAAVVGVVVGRTIRLRDEQVAKEPEAPTRPADRPRPGIPTQNSGAHDRRRTH